ncbi:MAG: hypothetical protein ACE5FT_04660 [Candidatus Nanoarchaeia archaeon]
MLEIESELKTWGRSIGVVIPKKAALHEKLKAGDAVHLLILKKTNALKETFGAAKLKRSTGEILEEIDKEGWDA